MVDVLVVDEGNATDRNVGPARKGNRTPWHGQDRGIVHRLDRDVGRHRCGFLAIGMIEVGHIDLEVEMPIAYPGAIEIRRALILQRIQGCSHVGNRTDQGDRIGIVAAAAGQAGRCTKLQLAFGRGVGQRGSACIVVQADRYRHILVKAVRVGKCETIECDRCIFIDRVACGTGQRRNIVAVRSTQGNILADPVVARVHCRAIGILGSRTAIGPAGQRPGVVI